MLSSHPPLYNRKQTADSASGPTTTTNSLTRVQLAGGLTCL